MVEQRKKELFPPLHSIEPCIQVPSGNRYLKPMMESLRVACPIALCFLLLVFCLLEASVDRYVSALM